MQKVLREKAPGETVGVEGSVLGPELSGKVVSALLRKYPDRRAGVLRVFMDYETDIRGALSPKREDEGAWGDAKNLYLPYLISSQAESIILSGEDVRRIHSKLDDDRERGSSNLAQKEKLAEIYFAARKRIFPEAPSPE